MVVYYKPPMVYYKLIDPYGKLHDGVHDGVHDNYMVKICLSIQN